MSAVPLLTEYLIAKTLKTNSNNYNKFIVKTVYKGKQHEA